MKWLTVKLADIAIEMQPGFAKQPSQDGLGLPQLRTHNVSADGQINLSTIKTVVASENEIAKYSLQARDIIFNNTNSPALVGKTAFFEENGHFLFSNHMTRIRVREDVVDAKFISTYLHWIWMQGGFRNLVTQWVNQAAINRIQLSRLSISLPPISEQHRIVEILDQADALRRMRAEADAKSDRILPALFIKMFGDPATNPMGWETLPISDLAEVQGGLQLTPKREQNPISMPYLRVANIYRDKLFLDEIKYIKVTKNELERIALQTDDILVVEGHGNRQEIGRCAIWDGSIQPCLHQNHLIRVRVDKTKSEPIYISAFINSSGGREQLFRFGKTTSGLNTISVSNVRNTMIPLPPLTLQKSYALKVQAVKNIQFEIDKQREKIDKIFSCILQRAFSGELTAKWREAHIKELLAEMEEQAKILNLRDKGDYQQLSML